jgi:predicted unusual protein kinase regulating ubiquinone biosynthesis (AarF/ABC1/UbiB family)
VVPVPRRSLVPAAALAAVAALAGAVAVARLRADERRRNRLVRTARIWRLTATRGAHYAVVRVRGAAADEARRAELEERFAIRTAEDVAKELGNTKGAIMKAGQLIGYIAEGLPREAQDALATRQADVPPMAPGLAAGVIRDELGDEPERLFLEWEEEPVAAASIGQVHRAITHDGRAVAVKVQYPGVGEAIRADLDNAGLLFGAMGMLFPGLEPGPLVEELRARLSEELDYHLEADNQQLFATYYDGHPFIHVPAVVHELSARRVLTTELAEGVPFAEVETWSQAERDLAAEAIFRFVFGSLYRLHAFNGDPHPGNYLFRPGGQVTFLDFGLVKRFDQHEVDLIADMLEAMVVDRDIAEYRRLIEGIGMLKPGNAFTDDQVQDYFGHFYDFVQRDEVSTITSDYASETVRRFFDAAGPYGPIMRAANVPPTFVIVQRINLGLYALFGQLHATANWRRMSEEIWPFLGGPPSTELGERAAAWTAARGAA